MKKSVVLKVILVVFVALALCVASESSARPLDKAVITFTFDDGQRSLCDLALPAMKKYKFPGTAYLATSLIGDDDHISWDQAWNLYYVCGWEIGNHSAAHVSYLGLTNAEIMAQLHKSQAVFVEHGLMNVGAFNPPYGDFDARVVGVLQQVGFITSCRQAWTEDSPFNFPDDTFNPWGLNVVSLRSDTMDYLKAKDLIDQAVSQKAWLPFVCHDFVIGVSSDPYQFNIATFKKVLAYVKKLQRQGKLTVETVAKGQSLIMRSKSLP